MCVEVGRQRCGVGCLLHLYVVSGVELGVVRWAVLLILWAVLGAPFLCFAFWLLDYSVSWGSLARRTWGSQCFWCLFVSSSALEIFFSAIILLTRFPAFSFHICSFLNCMHSWVSSPVVSRVTWCHGHTHLFCLSVCFSFYWCLNVALHLPCPPPLPLFLSIRWILLIMLSRVTFDSLSFKLFFGNLSKFFLLTFHNPPPKPSWSGLSQHSTLSDTNFHPSSQFAVINMTIKSNSGREGFISSYRSQSVTEESQGKSTRQELKQKPWKNAVC